MTARFVPLDRLRALAVVAMIQGHTFTALLAPNALPPRLEQLHAVVHGLTAPIFLFGAGLAFAVTTYPRFDAHLRGGPLLVKRLRRYGLILAIAYALQLPGASLLAALRLGTADLAPVLRIGPLHLIALVMTLCQLSIYVLRSPTVHASVMLAIAVAIAALSPAVYDSHVADRLGPVLAPWLDVSTGSLFPLFPWASFALFGVACGGLLPLHPAPPRTGLALFGAGLLLAAVSHVSFAWGVRLAPSPWFWHASPLYLAFRLGWVVCLLGVLHLGVTKHSDDRRGVGATLAQQSLVAYVVHLLLLYGTPLTPNLAHRLGPTLDLCSATVVFALILLFTTVLSRASADLSRGQKTAQNAVQIALTLLSLLVMLR